MFVTRFEPGLSSWKTKSQDFEELSTRFDQEVCLLLRGFNLTIELRFALRLYTFMAS